MGEESSSVVQCIRVVGGVFTVGEVSRVRAAGGTFDAVAVASGKHFCLKYIIASARETLQLH